MIVCVRYCTMHAIQVHPKHECSSDFDRYVYVCFCKGARRSVYSMGFSGMCMYVGASTRTVRNLFTCRLGGTCCSLGQ